MKGWGFCVFVGPAKRLSLFSPVTHAPPSLSLCLRPALSLPLFGGQPGLQGGKRVRLRRGWLHSRLPSALPLPRLIRGQVSKVHRPDAGVAARVAAVFRAGLDGEGRRRGGRAAPRSSSSSAGGGERGRVGVVAAWAARRAGRPAEPGPPTPHTSPATDSSEEGGQHAGGVRWTRRPYLSAATLLRKKGTVRREERKTVRLRSQFASAALPRARTPAPPRTRLRADPRAHTGHAHPRPRTTPSERQGRRGPGPSFPFARRAAPAHLLSSSRRTSPPRLAVAPTPWATWTLTWTALPRA